MEPSSPPPLPTTLTDSLSLIGPEVLSNWAVFPPIWPTIPQRGPPFYEGRSHPLFSFFSPYALRRQNYARTRDPSHTRRWP